MAGSTPPGRMGIGSVGVVTKSNRYSGLRLGSVEFVDYESSRLHVRWLMGDLGQTREEVEYTASMWSERSVAGGPPAKNSLVLCAFANDAQGQGRPIVLAFNASAFLFAKDWGIIRTSKTETPSDGSASIRYVSRAAFRKRYPGEYGIMAFPGSEAYFDERACLLDQMSDMFLLRPEDGAVVLTSLNNYVSNEAVRRKEGWVVRGDSIGGNLPSLSTTLGIAHPNGRKVYVITKNFQNFLDYDISGSDGAKPILEVREEIREFGDCNLPLLEEIHGVEKSRKEDDLLIIRVAGTVVGNDPNDSATYGKVLKPQIFTSRGSQTGEPALVPTTQDNEGVTKTSAAYVVQLPRTTQNFLIGVDKEGRLFLNVGKSVVSPDGGGISADLNFDGGIKAVVGATTDGEALNLVLKGDVNITIQGNYNLNVSKNMTETVGEQLTRMATSISDIGQPITHGS